jgi:hypothetical protein
MGLFMENLTTEGIVITNQNLLLDIISGEEETVFRKLSEWKDGGREEKLFINFLLLGF